MRVSPNISREVEETMAPPLDPRQLYRTREPNQSKARRQPLAKINRRHRRQLSLLLLERAPEDGCGSSLDAQSKDEVQHGGKTIEK